MKNCLKIQELISSYIDNEISDEEKIQVENHMCICKNCKEEYEQLKLIVDSFTGIDAEELPMNFHNELHDRLIKENSSSIVTKPFGSKFNWKLKVLSSIAASLLIVILSKGIFDSFINPMSYKMTESKSAPREEMAVGEAKESQAMDSVKSKSDEPAAMSESAEVTNEDLNRNAEAELKGDGNQSESVEVPSVSFLFNEDLETSEKLPEENNRQTLTVNPDTDKNSDTSANDNEISNSSVKEEPKSETPSKDLQDNGSGENEGNVQEPASGIIMMRSIMPVIATVKYNILSIDPQKDMENIKELSSGLGEITGTFESNSSGEGYTEGEYIEVELNISQENYDKLILSLKEKYPDLAKEDSQNKSSADVTSQTQDTTGGEEVSNNENSDPDNKDNTESSGGDFKVLIIKIIKSE